MVLHISDHREQLCQYSHFFFFSTEHVLLHLEKLTPPNIFDSNTVLSINFYVSNIYTYYGFWSVRKKALVTASVGKKLSINIFCRFKSRGAPNDVIVDTKDSLT